jgi:hypothetical protein
MIATLGEAHDLGWRLRIYCRFGKRDGMKSIRACSAYVDMDLPSLIWTRGRDFPIARLETRMKCPRCGSPAGAGRVRAAAERDVAASEGMTTMDEALANAIRRYEAETGGSIVEDLPGEIDPAIIELFLILHGFGPERTELDNPA